jgi:hypothetical protein
MKTLLSDDAWRKVLRLHEHEDIGIQALATRFGVSYNAIREGLAKRKAIGVGRQVKRKKRKTQR